MNTITPRKICIVTGTRAEYGLMRPLMQLLRDAPETELQIIATGMHLEEAFGMTVSEIENDGFNVSVRVPIELNDDSATGIARSMGLATERIAHAYADLKPDLLVMLGDRFEILAAAQVAMVSRIPIAHIHGGERTEGSIDEAIRHAVTKMAHLHFVTTDEFNHRVVQLGETPGSVFTVGAPALDTIATLKPMSSNAISASLDDFALNSPLLMVTYHPVTLSLSGQETATRALLDALTATPEARVLFTGVNADTEGGDIAALIHAWVDEHQGRAKWITSLGHERYLSTLAIADAVVGNSSSGLVEAPAMGVPTVNIGARQRGRPRAPSVIDCEDNAADIKTAIDRALDADMQTLAAERQTPFGGPGAAKKMFAIISKHPLDGILMKRFHDLS